MSTHVIISKKPSGHDLKIEVQNPGDAAPRTIVLHDGEFTEVLIHGNGTISAVETPKATA